MPRQMLLSILLAACVVVAPATKLAAQDDALTRLRAEMDAKPFQGATWGMFVIDAKTREPLIEVNPDALLCPASVTKLYSCAAALDALGSDHRFETRVTRHGKLRPEGVLDGTLVLWASGDPNLSGRVDAEGHLRWSNSDHIYSSGSEEAAVPEDVDPLGGLMDLAKQVHAAGVRSVVDVRVDDSRFDPVESSGSGPKRLTAAMVNDNLVDVLIRPTEVGKPALIELRPRTDWIIVESRVVTAKPEEGNAVSVSRMNDGRYLLVGRIQADRKKALVRSIAIDDPTAYARAMFIAALRAAGVDVTASAHAPFDPALLRHELGGSEAGVEVAKHVSPPFAEVVKVTLKVSHNLHASLMPVFLALKAGERNAAAGLRLQGEFLSRIGVDRSRITFGGAAGGARGDAVTARETVKLLAAMAGHAEAATYRDALPILGVDGTLAKASEADAPVTGMVRAKTGTYSDSDVMNGRALLNAKALAGYLTTAKGRELIFAVFVNNAPIDGTFNAAAVGRALGRLCGILHEAY